MNEEMENSQAQTCPQCDNHCPADALQCGRGRKYFGVTGDDHGHNRDHGGCCGHSHSKSGLASLLRQCGRFVRHADMEEDELFQALTGEEKSALQTLLEKLSADWRERCGEESFGCCGHGHHGNDGEKHHHKHEGRSK